MLNNIYLHGSIYHMVHFRNVESIFQRYALFSKQRLQSEGMTYSSIANDDVQNLRDRIHILDSLRHLTRSLHSYVPFYFAQRTPMLYVQYRKSLQSEIIFLEINRSIITENGVIFTSGNTTNQQLAKFGTETVFISPATVENPICARRYSCGYPQGQNGNRTDLYRGSVFLERLDWSVIDNDGWGGDAEKIRIKHAEVLVPDAVPLSRIVGISTLTQEKAYEVNKLIRKYGLESRLPDAESKSDLYFGQ